MATQPDSETDRLKAVYYAYAKDPAKRRSWSLDNPGNLAIWCERETAIKHGLDGLDLLPLVDRRVLDIGCGSGQVLAGFLDWGARSDNLFGVDLLADRIEVAKQQYPGIHFQTANAEHLEFEDEAFDIVLLITIFSSIRDATMQRQIASQAARVIKGKGVIIWYDIRYSNPANLQVRGIARREVMNLFPGFSARLQTITLLPPLARKLGAATPVLYPLLSRIRSLRSHYLALLHKE